MNGVSNHATNEDSELDNEREREPESTGGRGWWVVVQWVVRSMDDSKAKQQAGNCGLDEYDAVHATANESHYEDTTAAGVVDWRRSRLDTQTRTEQVR